MKYALCIFGGILAGGAAGYFITKKYYEKISGEEIAECREHYKSELEKALAKINTENEETEKVEEAEEFVKKSSSYVNYNNITKPASDIKNSKLSKAYAISADTFVNSEQYYDKITLTYNTADDELIDAEGDTIDIDSTIGECAVDIIAEDLDDDIFYFRNDSMSIDYEVVVERE